MIKARELFGQPAASFGKNNLLTYAGAIAFQLLVALVALSGLALLLIGSFGAQHVWYDGVVPALQGRLRPVSFQAVNDAATRVIETRRVLWLLLATALSIWEVSGRCAPSWAR